MSRKLTALFALVPLALVSFPVAATGQHDAVSGVVRVDPRAYGRPGSPATPGVPDITNVNTTNNPSAQNETTIDVNPVNNSMVVGGANDYRTGDANCGYTRSSNGGTSWTSGILMGITRGNGGTYDAAGDPSIYYGADGIAYYACLAFDRSYARSALILEKSSDGGVNWSTPSFIVQSNSISVFHDKEMLTIDNSPSSPYFGRLYVEWAEFGNNVTTAQEVVTYSSDHGATWATPILLSGSRTAVEGASPAVGPDGTVYAAWCAGSGYCDEFSVASTIYVNHSSDGGVTWSNPIAAANFTALPGSLPGNSFRVNSFPTTAVNPTNGHVYVVYAEYTGGNANIKLVRSTDQGVTWSSPITVNSRTNDDQFFQWMDVSPSGTIWVCYYDQSWNSSNWLDVGCSKSTNDGTSFSATARATTTSSNPVNDGFGGTFIGDYTGLGVSNTRPFPLWTDTRVGNAEAFSANP